MAAALNLNSGTYSVAAARYGAVVGLDPVCRVRRYGALNRRTVLPYTAGRALLEMNADQHRGAEQ